jgi:hypothetical protein
MDRIKKRSQIEVTNKTIALQERLAKEQPQVIADQERLQKERLAAHVRSLSINPDEI